MRRGRDKTKSMLPRGTISKIREYYFTHHKYKDEILRAMQEFFEYPDLGPGKKLRVNEFDEILFNEWLTYDFRFSDWQGMLEKYYNDNPHKLPLYRLPIYKHLQENYFGFYEVLEVNIGQDILLKNLKNNKEYRVKEVAATMNLHKGDVLVNRVANVGDHYELVGCDLPAFMISEINDSKKIWEASIKMLPHIKNLTPKDVRKIFN